MSDEPEAPRTVSVSGAKKPLINRIADSKTVKIQFSIPNLGKRYKIGEIIGSGGNSTVVEAFDLDLKRQVAIKLLKSKYHKNERAVGRFLNEARITAKLQHPGVVPVYETGYIGENNFFFSMKKVEGETFRDLLNTEVKNKTLNKLLDIFYTVCETMAYAHNKGITHRDLKPENIMIEKYGSILIMDWGLAKDNSDGTDESYRPDLEIKNRFDVNENIELTLTGEISGTPAYMSPEQALGMMNKLSHRSDVFSLGIILYEIITGYNPFSKNKNNNFRAIFEAIKHDKPLPPLKDFRGKKVRAELAAICMKCLEKLPNERYQDAEELSLDLKNFRTNHPVSAFRTGIREDLSKWMERHTRGLIFTAVLVTAVMLAYFYKKTLDAELSGILNLISDKVEQVKKKDGVIKQIEARFAGVKDPKAKALINTHHLQRASEWQTAKKLVIYLSAKPKNNLKAADVDFIKENWFKEINTNINENFYEEAENNLEDFLSCVEKFKGRWNLSEEEKLIVKSYLRILGKEHKFE